MRSCFARCALLLLVFAAALLSSRAQDPEVGYAVRKPVLGGACPLCPWGVMAEVVKEALEPYGWEAQICYVCQGGPRAARMVAGAMMPARRPGDNEPHPLPNGPLDFGVTGTHFLQWAYLGIDVFANDPEGPRRHLRLVANIQEPTYLLVAVESDSGITSLSDIVEKRLAVDMVARTGIGGNVTPTILEYYGLSQDRIESLGGTYRTGYRFGEDADVVVGFGSLVNAPEYRLWYELSQKYDLKFLELAPDLRERLVRDLYLDQMNVPLGLFRGVDRPIPTVARTGIAVYGRDDMPEEFAYTLAQAMDEQQHLLQWTHMNFSYNPHTVWKGYDVPLHPGAAHYYRERGYME